MYRSLIILVLSFVKLSHSFSDIGKWDLPLSGESCSFDLAKSLSKDTKLRILIHCDVKTPTNITVGYTWGMSHCSPDYLHYFEQRLVICKDKDIRTVRAANVQTPSNATWMYLDYERQHKCESKNVIILDDGMKLPDAKKTDDKGTPVDTHEKYEGARRPILTVEKEGIYVLHVGVHSDTKFNATVTVEMLAPHGYMSAAVWPLLPFFGVMCGVYTILCLSWLIVCGLNWRDLLRIQYWIGGVALLGMVESATYYGVYSSINHSGYFNAEAYMFAEWVSIAKRALARMLVIIVSLGFGIVKPRLGPALQRVVGAGALWGVLACAEAWLRLHHKAEESNRDLLLAEAPLSLLDSAICWWVFVSLAHTMRTLQLRRNAIKLSLYRHFTNTLIFAVIMSVIFMLYSIKNYRVTDCIMEWKEVWVDEAYWHILFASVLAVIMVLWRPTNNNQRYAFTPLLDNAEDDDEEEEQFVNDAYGVKMRGPSINAGDSGSELLPQDSANTLESDLRWVEENIPTSSLPLLDSDEEIINTKFEVSKMQ